MYFKGFYIPALSNSSKKAPNLSAFVHAYGPILLVGVQTDLVAFGISKKRDESVFFSNTHFGH